MSGYAPLSLVGCDSESLWHFRSDGLTEVCVVVTLYNYADYILETLNSLRLQSYSDLGLLIVDDSSSDGGDVLVLGWLEEYGREFRRATLLRHRQNAGLAAARNTGFAHACSPWVWVQDADNPLAPWAIQQAHRVAINVAHNVAVIHSLLVTTSEDIDSPPFQGDGRPWQSSGFARANYVDAMALIRHEAWMCVGGYSHIPGGWEDYDFWCKLIEAGWSGVQCPQVLGTYRVHPSSMTSLTSLPDARRLETILKKRHPWLNCEGWTSGGRQAP